MNSHVKYESSVTLIESIATVTIHAPEVHLILITIIFALSIIAERISHE